MNTNSSSRSGLFLMELIISILFFSLAGAVCVRLFVSSHIISKDSVELNHSLEWCQNVAEAFYGCNGNAEKMTELFSNCCISNSSATEAKELCLVFDKDFNPIPVSNRTMDLSLIDCYYTVSAKISEEDRLLLCQIKALKRPDSSGTAGKETAPIYELSVTLFPEKEVPHEE